MTFWIAIRRLLPLLAVLSLSLAPVTASAAAAGMRAPMAMGVHSTVMLDGAMDEMAGMAMDDMPCCPNETPAAPDCSNGCPLMALCLAKVTSALPAGIGLPMRCAAAQGASWSVSANFDSLTQRPLPEPPRS